MREASLILEKLAVPYEKKIVSAHRTPDWLLVTPAPQLGTNLPRVLKEVPNFPEYWKIHLYGKHGNLEARRKMGHLTIKTSQPDQEVTRIKTIFPE
jgi:hypothetical protein